ncbi:MAG: hypothetical protein EAZ27_09570 [Cytophagales bacterium]|nr:MAG: hypothetical protein EAZ27_09570 [Cytophagales bacterium]
MQKIQNMAQSYQLPHAIREELFKDLAKEKAVKLTDLIEKSIDAVFTSAKDIAVQKKLEIKDELSKELVSKADIALVKADIAILESKLEKKITIYFMILLCTMIILNKDSITLIGQLLGLAK